MTRDQVDVKVVMLGDAGAGKTAVLKRFFDDVFEEESPSTIGIDFRHRVYHLEDESSVRLQLWDTAGQERFRQLVPSYIREAAVAIIVFDLTDKNATQQILRWIRYVERERGRETRVLLVGNKCDLKADRVVSSSEITSLMLDYSSVYMETSAKTGENIKELFSCVAHLPFPHHASNLKKIQLAQRRKQTTSSCCS